MKTVNFNGSSAPESGQLKSITLAAALEAALAVPDRTESTMSDLRSAVSFVAKVVDRPASEISFDLDTLRELLTPEKAARQRASMKRLANVKSAIKTIAIAAGAVDGNHDRREPLEGPWRDISRLVPSGLPWVDLRRLVRYLARQGIEPGQINLATIEAWRAYLKTRTLLLDVDHRVTNGVRRWNRALDTIAAWPQVRLTLPRRTKQYAPLIAELDPQFQGEYQAYIDLLSGKDPLAENSPKEPLRPRTLDNYREGLLRAVALLESTGVPRASISSLAVLTDPVNYAKILIAAYHRAGGRWTLHTGSLAQVLFNAASNFIKLPEDQLATLQKHKKRATVVYREISSKIRKRLRQFDDPVLRRRLIELPTAIAEDAVRRKAMTPVRAAQVFEMAVAIEILFCTLMRRRNLCSLDVAEHLQRDHQGRIVGIMVSPDEVKNRIVIDCTLPLDARARLQRFMKEFRPLLPGANESTWLFPSVGGGHRSPHTMSIAISKQVSRRLGAKFNVHLARHLGAMILLEEDPNNLPTVQYLLGHKSIDTTAAMYGVIRNRGAQAQWHQHLAGRVKLLRRS